MTTIFIVGAPRSGTTWLQSLLAGHPRLASPPELHLFANCFAPIERAWKEQLERRNRLAAAGFQGGVGLHNILDETEIIAWMSMLFDRVHRSALAIKPGATTLLEKTPSNAFFLPLIRRIVPGAKFIHVVRDPRDAVASLMDVSRRPFGEWAPSTLSSATAVWKDHVLAALRDSRPEDTTLVRYEDLRTHPYEVLGALAGVLGLEGPPDAWVLGDHTTPAVQRVVDTSVRRRLPDEPAVSTESAMLPSPFSSPTLKRLSGSETWFVESQCAAEMEILGYAIGAFRPGWRNTAGAAAHRARLAASALWRRTARLTNRALNSGRH